MFNIHGFSRKSVVFASVGVLAFGAAGTLATVRIAHAAGSGSAPVTVMNTTANAVPVALQGTTAVTGTVGISGTPLVNAQQSGPWNVGMAVPASQFSAFFISAVPAKLVSGPDPSGTRYAITSLVFARDVNADTNASFAFVFANDCNDSLTNRNGPGVTVPAGQTVVVPLPQPFVLAGPGAQTCLYVGFGGSGSGTGTVVGYRL